MDIRPRGINDVAEESFVFLIFYQGTELVIIRNWYFIFIIEYYWKNHIICCKIGFIISFIYPTTYLNMKIELQIQLENDLYFFAYKKWAKL